MFDALFAFQGRYWVLAQAFALSLGVQALVVANALCLARALHIQVPPADYFFMVPLALFAMMVPISINGVGVRESVWAFFLVPFGVATSTALAFAWLDYGLILAQAVIGGMVYAFSYRPWKAGDDRRSRRYRRGVAVRVLLLAPHPFFQQRGTPIAERMLLEALLAQGHQVEVLTFHEGEDPGIPGCPIHRIPRLPFVRGIRPGFSAKKLLCDAVMLASCLRLIRRRRYDLVHAVEESAFMALLTRRLFRVPYVYDMDSGLAQQMTDKFPPLARVRPALEWFERLAVRGSSGVLAVCRAVEDKAREYDPGCLVARLEDVTLLPASTADIGSAARPVESLPDLAGGGGGPIVLYVGNLETYQGIDLLLAGFARAVREVPAARLVVIGGAPEHIRHYEEVVARAGIGESVRFAGPRPLERLGRLPRAGDGPGVAPHPGHQHPDEGLLLSRLGAPAPRHPPAHPHPGTGRRGRLPGRARTGGLRPRPGPPPHQRAALSASGGERPPTQPK